MIALSGRPSANHLVLDSVLSNTDWYTISNIKYGPGIGPGSIKKLFFSPHWFLGLQLTKYWWNKCDTIGQHGSFYHI